MYLSSSESGWISHSWFFPSIVISLLELPPSISCLMLIVHQLFIDGSTQRTKDSLYNLPCICLIVWEGSERTVAVFGMQIPESKVMRVTHSKITCLWLGLVRYEESCIVIEINNSKCRMTIRDSDLLQRVACYWWWPKGYINSSLSVYPQDIVQRVTYGHYPS